MRGTQNLRGKWAARFIRASIVHGALAVLWTIFIVDPFVRPAPSMVIAGGSAGTWLLLGYVLYLTVGVIATAVTAIFYFYIEGVLGKVYSGLTGTLAWLHFVFMNTGVAAATWMLMLAGYVGGAALLPQAVGGGGLTAGQVHAQILQYYVEPIFVAVILAAAGATLGGLGYLLRSRKE